MSDDLARKVEELAGLLDAHRLTAIKVREGDFAVEVRRDSEPGFAVAPVTDPRPEPRSMEGEVIPSPTVGVFYRRPSPDEDPFVQDGERISVGQVVGVIEAMKVFNEIESPISGVIRSCLVEDGALVQEGDPLFIVDV